jgi:hypothetical protein
MVAHELISVLLLGYKFALPKLTVGKEESAMGKQILPITPCSSTRILYYCIILGMKPGNHRSEFYIYIYIYRLWRSGSVSLGSLSTYSNK